MITLTYLVTHYCPETSYSNHLYRWSTLRRTLVIYSNNSYTDLDYLHEGVTTIIP